MAYRVGQSEGSEESRLKKLRPYERSRCAEHGGSYSKYLGSGVPAPPGMGMIAAQTLLHNASMAQI
jgi:hypothetical protein